MKNTTKITKKTQTTLYNRKEEKNMKKIITKFIADQRGVNTLEILIIAAVLVAVALLFRTQLMSFVEQIIGPIFGSADKITEGLETTTSAVLNVLVR